MLKKFSIIFKKPAIFRGLTAIFAFLLVVTLLAADLLEANRTMVDQALGTKSEIIITEEDEENPTLYTAFTPDEDILTDGKLDRTKNANTHTDLYTRLHEEGAVLLKNENKTLPLTGEGAEKPKVTLLGGGINKNYPNLRTALGKVFDVNPTVTELYSNSGLKYSAPNPGWALNKTLEFTYNLVEPSVAELRAVDPDFDSSFTQYNDAAIIVLVRGNGEGADYRPGTAGTQGGVARSALALYPNEKEIIKLATDNFKKVIVLIKTISAMELGELKDDPKVGAVMWVGNNNGEPAAAGIANLLSGKANPSGGLADVYARNSMSSPAMRNFGRYVYANVKEVGGAPYTFTGEGIGNNSASWLYTFTDSNGQTGTRLDTTTRGTRGTDRGFDAYVIQQEGIYYGYRYYETRYYDTVMNQFGAKTKTDTTGVYEDSKTEWNYSEEMVWTFGYGLSYTTFEMNITGLTWDKKAHEQIAHLTVTVKNTGDVAGKTPVQVYGQSPYTQYDKTNLVEKSAIQLLTFEKTKLLQPDETQTLTIDVDLQDLASYDYKKAKTYIMDTGDYYFAVGNGAHDALNNILAVQGKTTADGMDYDGRKQAAYKWSYDAERAENGVDAFTFSQSKAGVTITNQLQYADLNDYDGYSTTYLSRQDWVGTFPKSPVTDNNYVTSLKAEGKLFQHVTGNYIDVHTADKPDTAANLAGVKFGQETELKFGHMRFASFDDERWAELIDAMTLEELIDLCVQSGRGFAAVNSIGFPGGSLAENGPGTPSVSNAPWNDDGKGSAGDFSGFALIASTFSRELAHEYGRRLGNDSVLSGKPMMWRPGANIHRTPYGGRSEQYQSEDPVLTGIISMEESHGALQMGCIVTVKHFAFNDQEMGRSGVSTFMTEQKAREIELHAFQIAFEMNKYDTPEKDVGTLGVMTAFNKLGGIEVTAHKGLLTGILHDEWGYRGYIVSDLKDDLDLAPQLFKAGHGGYDWRDAGDLTICEDSEDFKYDAELLKAMKEIAHQKLWVFANSNYMNTVNGSSYSKWNMTWWRMAYRVGIGLSASLLGVSAILGVAAYIFKKKENN